MTSGPLRVAPHARLDLAARCITLPCPLAELPASVRIAADPRELDSPFEARADLRQAVRDMLRLGGFKPSGRSKPACEYLVRALEEERWPRINPVVDACNLVSWQSQLPMSVVDLAKTQGALEVRIAAPGTRYVFNPAGQEIDVTALICLFDAAGPIANAVKDAQRTKTDPQSRTLLALVWGTQSHQGRAERAAQSFGELLAEVGASVDAVAFAASDAG